MTLEEKIARYRSIPKRVAELEIDKDICTSVKAVRYSNIGDGKGTPENNTEIKMVDAAVISVEIDELRKERDTLKLDILQEINNVIVGDGAHEVDMRIILKKHLLEGENIKAIANKVVHRDYGVTRRMYQEGLARLKNLTQSHSIPPNLTCRN